MQDITDMFYYHEMSLLLDQRVSCGTESPIECRKGKRGFDTPLVAEKVSKFLVQFVASSLRPSLKLL